MAAAPWPGESDLPGLSEQNPRPEQAPGNDWEHPIKAVCAPGLASQCRLARNLRHQGVAIAE